MKKSYLIYFLIAAISLTKVAFAAPVEGVIGDLFYKKRELVIDGQLYKIAKEIPIKVFGSRSQFIKFSELTVGNVLQVRYSGSSKKKRHAIEVFILPQ